LKLVILSLGAIMLVDLAVGQEPQAVSAMNQTGDPFCRLKMAWRRRIACKPPACFESELQE